MLLLHAHCDCKLAGISVDIIIKASSLQPKTTHSISFHEQSVWILLTPPWRDETSASWDQVITLSCRKQEKQERRQQENVVSVPIVVLLSTPPRELRASSDRWTRVTYKRLTGPRRISHTPAQFHVHVCVGVLVHVCRLCTCTICNGSWAKLQHYTASLPWYMYRRQFEFDNDKFSLQSNTCAP